MIWKGRCDDMESKHEYLENVSRRNNIKILGLLEDKLKEKSWDDTEELVKGVIKEKLKFDTEVKIERADRVGSHVLHLNHGRWFKEENSTPSNFHARNRRKLFCKLQETSSQSRQREFVFSRTFRQEHCRGEVIKYPS